MPDLQQLAIFDHTTPQGTERPADRPQQGVEASAWFPKIKFRQDAMIKEQSWDLGESGTVLTLLWIDQDI